MADRVERSGYTWRMFTPAFSTVACPEWPLEVVAAKASEFGFLGVELRSFGDASRSFASDPALTAPEKVREVFRQRGVDIVSLATSARFDGKVNPPVIGWAISDTERPVRFAQRAVELAATIAAPLLRVFGFELPPSERRASAMDRVVTRLKKVVDAANRTGVRVAIENAGSFRTSDELIELIDAVGGPLVGAMYNVAVAHEAGEQPADGVEKLGARLLGVRVKDLRDGKPVLPGEGGTPVRAALAGLARRRFTGPVIYEWDRAWMPELAAPEVVLPRAAKLLFEAGAASGVRAPHASIA